MIQKEKNIKQEKMDCNVESEQLNPEFTYLSQAFRFHLALIRIDIGNSGSWRWHLSSQLNNQHSARSLRT